MNKRRVAFIIAIVVLVFADLALGGIVQVDCTKPDQTLTRALQTAQPGDTIRVTRTCKETITITMDDLTLEGHNQALIDGQGAKQSVITIDGARRVTIKQITVQRGDNGIYVLRGASVTLDGVIAQDNADDGIEIGKNASAQLIRTSAVRNADDGIEADENATVHLTDCTAQDNGDDGFTASRNASMTLMGTNISSKNGETVSSSSRVPVGPSSGRWCWTITRIMVWRSP